MAIKISCFLYHKVTKLKANHNEELAEIYLEELFPISQIH